MWLFYVQHQFEDAYWERREDWDDTAAAPQGSSFHELPKLLQRLSGNIGFHHIHHLSSRIPPALAALVAAAPPDAQGCFEHQASCTTA